MGVIAHPTKCFFKSPRTTKTGWGIIYTNDAKTHAALLVNSSIALIKNDGVLYSANECELEGSNSFSRRIVLSEVAKEMIQGSDEKDGVYAIYVAEVSGQPSLPTVQDLCVHRPRARDLLILIGIEHGEIVTSQSRGAAEVPAGRNFAMGSILPPRDNLVAAIDANRNCFLGLVSREHSMFLPYASLHNVPASGI